MDKPEQLRDLRVKTQEGGGPVRKERQRSKGKMTARERLRYLLDRGSFHEVDAFVVHREGNFGLDRQKILSDSVVTGWGTLLTDASSTSSARISPSLAAVSARFTPKKIVKIMDMAMKNGAPRHRHQRFRWRTHPGRRRQSRRLR